MHEAGNEKLILDKVKVTKIIAHIFALITVEKA